ncbi:MAG: protein kinase [Scytonema sp. RU_4_4]|nr:protein kinase [Scytonema sp. RU_4_4]
MNSQLLGGRYQITQVLARGGFGQTYLAADTHRPGHPLCVVKQLRPINQSPQLMPKIHTWFKNEAETLEKLGLHNQIPQLLAYFEEQKEFYLVQEYIAGHILSHELVRGQLWNSNQVICLLTEILEILVFVHSHGVIHRDIKPSNIIRRQTDNKLVLIDFGTVKQIRTLNSQGQLNLTLAVGTPAYMPIEQFNGYPQLNSDIYAVGVIGIQAVSGLSAQEIRSIIDPRSPYAGIESWQDRCSVSPELAAILDKMTSSDYRQRYQTAASVLSELKNINTGTVPTTVNVPVSTSTPKTTVSPTAAPTSNSVSQSTSHTAIDLPEPPSGDPASKTAKTHLSGETSTTVNYHTIKRRKLVSWLSICGGIALAIAVAFYYLPKQDIKPDIKERKLTLVRTLSGHTGSVWSVALSADGLTLVSGSEDKTIKIWHPNTGQLSRTLKAHSDSVRTVSLSSDGQTLVSGSGDDTIKIWQSRTGELRHTLRGHSLPVWSVAFSRDGQILVSGSQDNTIKVWNAYTGELVRTLKGHSAPVYSVALSSDGFTLISGSQDKTIKVWDVQTGKLLRTIEGHTSAVRSIAISPDGQTLASGSWDQTIKIWNIHTGSLLHTLKGHSDRVVGVSFSFDGKSLMSASIDKTIKVWNFQTGELRQTISGHSDWVLSVATSSWGHTLISGSRDKTIKIWQ